MKHLSCDTVLNSQQPTANSQQPTANSQQPTANSQQPTANSQQPTANSQQPTANIISEIDSTKKNFQDIKTLKAYQLLVKVFSKYSIHNQHSDELTAELDNLKRNAIKYLGAGFYSFDIELKKDFYNKSRAELGAMVALWHFYSKENDKIIEDIEKILIPALSALIRKLEKKIEKN